MIVINHELVRTGLKMLFSSWANLQVVGEASHTREALQSLESARPDILVVDGDPEMKDSNLDFLSKLVAATSARIILLTAHRETELLSQMAVRGVSGIVNKDDAATDLKKAVEKVHQGEIWLTRTLMAHMINSLSKKKELEQIKPEAAMINSLTEREREVARLVCEGLKNKEIGERLFISETTVRHHLSSVFSKLKVSARFDLIIFLYRNGFASFK